MFVTPKALRPNVKVDKNKLERRLNRQEDWLKRTGRLREFLPNEYEEVVKVGDKLDKRMIDKSALIATLGTVTTLDSIQPIYARGATYSAREPARRPPDRPVTHVF